MNNRNQQPKTKALKTNSTTSTTKPTPNVPLSNLRNGSASCVTIIENPIAKMERLSIATTDSGDATSVDALSAFQRRRTLIQKSASFQPGWTTTTMTMMTTPTPPTTTATPTKPQRSRKKTDDKLVFSSYLTPRQLETLLKHTHFKQHELEGLAVLFRQLVVHSNAQSRAQAAYSRNAVIPRKYVPVDGIDAECFYELLHGTFDNIVEEVLIERMFIAWQCDHDRQPLRLEPFLFGLSVFLRGTLSERIGFCFRVYDLDADGWISRDEMFRLLSNSLIHPPLEEEDPDEAVREWVDIIVRRMDSSQDGKISFADYSTAVRANPLLLEAFGQCLPTPYSVTSFMSKLV